ncbi:hypothetical protein OAO87_02755 [bacterium]|nr:hypothetical protein [bacterium]
MLTEVAAPAISHAGICPGCDRATAVAAGGDVGARVSDAFIRKLHAHGVTEARDITTRTVAEYCALLGGLTAAELAQLRSVGVRTDAEMRLKMRLREAYLRRLADDAPLDLDATRAHEGRAAGSHSGITARCAGMENASGGRRVRTTRRGGGGRDAREYVGGNRCQQQPRSP